jgi:outer membrane protein assembly factor BamB
MTRPVSRREVLVSLGGALAAGTIADCLFPVAANAAAGPPPPRNTGTIGSKTVPRTAWTYTADGPLGGLRYATGRTFVITQSGVTALDARTGRELWQIPLLTTGTAFGDAIADGTWYVCGLDRTGDAYGLLAVDCATGDVRWAYAPPEGVALDGTSSPLGGAIYVSVYAQDAGKRQVWAIDTTSRQVRWKSPCGMDSTSVYAPTGGTLVFSCASAGYDMIAFDAAPSSPWRSDPRQRAARD